MNLENMSENKVIILFVRLALAFAFLSAVADRFGFWGASGESNVAWGDFAAFEGYVAYLNPFLSQGMVFILSWIVTIAEVVLALMLIIGFKLRLASMLSGIMLLGFGLFMTVIMGIKVPFDYSVFTASATCFILYLFVKQNEIAATAN